MKDEDIILSPFQEKNGIKYYKHERDYFAVGDDPKFCFRDTNLKELEKLVERALLFFSESDNSKINRQPEVGDSHMNDVIGDK